MTTRDRRFSATIASRSPAMRQYVGNLDLRWRGSKFPYPFVRYADPVAWANVTTLTRTMPVQAFGGPVGASPHEA